MTFEQFAKLYERDIKPKLKLNTLDHKREHHSKENSALFWQTQTLEITARDIICCRMRFAS